MDRTLPSNEAAKALAKRLRLKLQEQGTCISHGQSLELVAHQYGFRDWNTFRAAISDRQAVDWKPGNRVRGAYLSHPFLAEIIAVEALQSGWFRLTLELDKPIDVVRSEDFSNLRKRVTGVIGPAGRSKEKTSDGFPHLIVEAL
ncbi:glyoxalase superfamily protein [Nitratireductor indicus]|uniref:glyoxalase superfamily protein n=1 Tax=Nitratireductor indicus TaxID=721133 RepID=UPI002875433C|nr:glyoxalase superfamily protein [Nitratireductor indicus]MDS1136555.1 glyoxalase superfamily protein [Nitratireductor indicus]